MPSDDPPPFHRPIATSSYRFVVFVASDGELVEEDTATLLHPGVAGRDLVWATWRPATLEELVRTRPSRSEPTDGERARGWWQPTKTELVEARKEARSLERRRRDGT